MNPVPERFRLQLLKPLRATPATEALSETWGDVLVLMGPVGTGKTLAACSWLRSWEGDGFMTAAELARWPRYDMAAMKRLLEKGRLVVDDLGTEYMDDKGNFLAVFDEFVNTRCANMKQTIITTNLAPEAFRARYGERITDRIVECGRFVSVAGESMRSPENQAAVKANREEEIAAAHAARAAEKQTCKLHLYGAGYGHECNARCPHWGKDLASPKAVQETIRALAEGKAVK